jgi:hypothetical protein
MLEFTAKKCLPAAFALTALVIAGMASASAKPLRNEALQDQFSPSFGAGNPRDDAVHDCSVAAGKWSMMSWQSTQLQVYRECMDEHGQPE